MPPRIRKRASKALKENIDSENKSKTTKGNTKPPRKALADKTNSASDDNSVDFPKKIRKTTVTNENLQPKQNSEAKNKERPRRDRRLPTRLVENPVLANLTNSKERIPVSNGENTNVKELDTSRSNSDNVLGAKATNTLNAKGNNILKAKAMNILNAKTTISLNAKSINAQNVEPLISPNFNQINVLKSKATSTLTPKSTIASAADDTSPKANESDGSLFKTPSKAENSLVVSRPRRICRLPSRFDDHLVSPNKYIPIQPDNASTPIQQSKIKPPLKSIENVPQVTKTPDDKKISAVPQTRSTRAAARQKRTKDVVLADKHIPDSNNNAKGRSTRAKKSQKPQPLPPMKVSPQNSIRKFFNKTTSPLKSPNNKSSPKPANTKRIIDKSLSFQVLGGKKRSLENDKNGPDDIYEFTFDPNEEPQPPKKKRKKPVTKKPPKSTKPKTAVPYRSAYEQNISKALSALKKVVKPSKPEEPVKLPQIQEISDEAAEIVEEDIAVINNMSHENKENHDPLSDTSRTSNRGYNYPSIRVEDIAADIEPSIDNCDDINYSPVNSPMQHNEYVTRHHSPAPVNSVVDSRKSPEEALSKDPLNLQEDLSFFDDVPVASSSMNVSVRHPSATPWRVEFGSLPIKWHVNTYVKPNMTPALESSFICSEDANKKKHVYTNMIPDANESLPQIVSNTPSLKQTNLISFIKEVAERQAKKKRGRSVSPTKVGVMPVAAKSKGVTNADAVNRVYEEMKSAADAPVLRKRNVETNVTNTEEPTFNDDSQSVHLFEDIEVVHHIKPNRKSYGKTKKVQFCQRSTSDSDPQEDAACNDDRSSFEDDLGDLTFEVPNVKEKKKSKKKKSKKLMSKKEEKEAEAWAAGFNSMCEEIEDFPLVVE